MKLLVLLALAQLPPEFYQEIHRLEHLRKTSADKPTVSYALARTWASGEQYREALAELRRVAALNVGLDPSNDSQFAKVRDTPEFQAVLEMVRAATPPLSHSSVAFRLQETDLAPEGIAYDGRRFYLGSTSKGKIVRCTMDGACENFAEVGLREVLGLRVDPQTPTLWAACNGDAESAVMHYDLATGKLLEKRALPGKHTLNDLVVTKRGDVFVTDTRAGAVYRNSEVFVKGVTFANGIALSDDEAKLYVADFGDGIAVVDIATGARRPIARPSNLCLATIDGLYFHAGHLIAIQNGIMTHRVIKMQLDSKGTRIKSFEVLARRDPQLDEITTGALAGDALYCLSNTQVLKIN